MIRIRELRKSNGITAKKLGEAINVSESTVSLYENGKRAPDYDTLIRIANFFNVSVDYLLGREEKEKPTGIADGLSDDMQLIAQLVTKLTEEQLPYVLTIAQNIPALSIEQLASVAEVIKNMNKK